MGEELRQSGSGDRESRDGWIRVHWWAQRYGRVWQSERGAIMCLFPSGLILRGWGMMRARSNRGYGIFGLRESNIYAFCIGREGNTRHLKTEDLFEKKKKKSVIPET